MLGWFKKWSLRLLRLEKNNKKLALSSSLGIYIAFSPFIGFHTVMVMMFSWLFGLNIAVLFAVSILINNPGTMMPVYGLGYWVGDIIFSSIGINHHAFNPGWVKVCNAWLAHYFGGKGFSFWAFMLGGNVLGLILAISSYPLIKWAVTLVGIKSKERMRKTVARSQRVVRSLKTRAAPVLRRFTSSSRSKWKNDENSGAK